MAHGTKLGYRIFIQARMSSERLPGKVLNLLHGTPIIRSIIEKIVESQVDFERILLLTSVETSDDPLAVYAMNLGLSVFRGPLDNVVERFVQAENEFPCNWIIRVTGDSPFLQPQLLKYFVEELSRVSTSLITTTYKRTFPKGMNLEAFRSVLLQETVKYETLTDPEKEHVTSFWYRKLPSGGLTSIELEDDDYSRKTVAIDTLSDLDRANNGDCARISDSVPWDQLIARKVTR